MGEPVSGCGAVEEVPVGAQGAPGFFWGDGCGAADSEVVEGDAVGVEEPGDVVVGADEECGGVGEGGVVGEQGGVDVPVGEMMGRCSMLAWR